MMKRLLVRYDERLEGKTIEEIHNNCMVIPTEGITCNNWHLPGMCSALFGMVYTTEYLYISYMWDEADAPLKHFHDMEAVCEDSCVEFFCTNLQEDKYLNFEFNRIGVCNASKRRSRHEDVHRFTDEERARILRAYTPRNNDPLIHEKTRYRLTIGIPLDFLDITGYTTFPITIHGNFYKCADLSVRKHLQSWNPIDLPEPNFHCPEFFGEIVLK